MNKYPISGFSKADRRERLLAIAPQIESIFADHAISRHTPSITYGLILDGELVVDHGIGNFNLASEQIPTADTVYRIASMTKSFAAAAILQLRDEGYLRLDEPAATYVPELAELTYPTADSAPITVRQLLSMNAGWPQDDPWADRQLYQTDDALSDFYRGGISWSNPPGVTFEYSNVSYMVLGRIITNVSAMPAIDYVTENILKPLDMNDTFWNAHDVPPERLAHGYRWEDEEWKPEALLPTGGDVVAFAGIFTTIRDLTKWVDLFLSAWPARDDEHSSDEETPNEASNRVLSRSSLREMQRIWTAGPPSLEQSALGAKPMYASSGYGFGLSLLHNGQWMRVGHGGGLPGFGTYMCWAPKYGVGVVGLSNVTYGAVGIACIEALELIIEKGGIERRSLPLSPQLAAAQEQMVSLLQEWDDNIAAELLADNFLLDRDKEHRLKAFAKLAEQHGTFSMDGPIKPLNWLRGTWRMTSDHGWCDFFISLSPTMPPRIQTLRFNSTLLPSPELEEAMKVVAALVSEPAERELGRLCISSLLEGDSPIPMLWDQVRLANIMCGESVVGKVTGGDGDTWVRFELDGIKRSVYVRLEVDAQGQISHLSFKPEW